MPDTGQVDAGAMDQEEAKQERSWNAEEVQGGFVCWSSPKSIEAPKKESSNIPFTRIHNCCSTLRKTPSERYPDETAAWLSAMRELRVNVVEFILYEETKREE